MAEECAGYICALESSSSQLCLCLKITYYSQNYASIIYQALSKGGMVQWCVELPCPLPPQTEISRWNPGVYVIKLFLINLGLHNYTITLKGIHQLQGWLQATIVTYDKQSRFNDQFSTLHVSFEVYYMAWLWYGWNIMLVQCRYRIFLLVWRCFHPVWTIVF